MSAEDRVFYSSDWDVTEQEALGWTRWTDGVVDSDDGVIVLVGSPLRAQALAEIFAVAHALVEGKEEGGDILGGIDMLADALDAFHGEQETEGGLTR